MSIQDIRAYVALGDQLALGGQPSQEQLAQLRQDGFEQVINLGLSNQAYSLADEAGSAAKLGLGYRHIPVDFKAPGTAQLQEFFAAMDEAEGRRTFVHCAANYRVTVFASLWLRARHGWNAAQAEALIAQVWQPDETWRAFLEREARALGLETGVVPEESSPAQ